MYVESGMDFLPLFEKGTTFYIEKSRFLKGLGDGVRTVEFLSLAPVRKLLFIEAKSSAPNPDNKGDFNKYCEDLLEKVQHSIDLFASKELEVNKDIEKEFPDCFGERFQDYRFNGSASIRSQQLYHNIYCIYRANADAKAC